MEQVVRKGRPRSKDSDFHTSLIVERDLYVRVKTAALKEGRTFKDVLHEALRQWLDGREERI